MGDDILRKVRKLLSLASDNPSDEESQSALLKAQELMALHSIELSEVEDSTDTKEVVHEDVTDRGRTPLWKTRVASIVSQNFRCQHYQSSYGGKSKIIFLGLKQDVLLAKEVFQFACDSLQYHSRRYVRKRKEEDAYGNLNARGLRNDFIEGFLNGLESKFAKQVEEKGWGLVLIKHELVKEEVDKMNFRYVSQRSNIRREYDEEAKKEGYTTGNKLELKKQLQ